MKALNIVKFISEATLGFDNWLRCIDEAETYEEAKRNGYAAMGFLDCMIDFLNCANCMEEDLNELLDEWEAEIYQRMATKADQTGQRPDLVISLFKKRDNARNG